MQFISRYICRPILLILGAKLQFIVPWKIEYHYVGYILVLEKDLDRLA